MEMIQFQKRYAFYFSNMTALQKYESDTVGTADRQLAVREKLIVYYSEVIRNFEAEGIFEPLTEQALFLSVIMKLANLILNHERYL